MNGDGYAQPSGNLALKVIRGGEETSEPPNLQIVKPDSVSWQDIAKLIIAGLPSPRASRAVNIWRLKNLRHLARGARRVVAAKALGVTSVFGALYLKVKRRDGSEEDLGLASLRVVTTAGVGYIVDAFQNLTELENMKFHALGTGAAAEASSDTALGTELTTQYNPDNTRATGSTTESAANIYRTVGTNTVDATAAVTEHGVLSQAATGGGVLLDRSVFSVVNLASGDSLQSTYDFTINAGG